MAQADGEQGTSAEPTARPCPSRSRHRDRAVPALHGHAGRRDDTARTAAVSGLGPPAVVGDRDVCGGRRAGVAFSGDPGRDTGSGSVPVRARERTDPPYRRLGRGVLLRARATARRGMQRRVPRRLASSRATGRCGPPPGSSTCRGCGRGHISSPTAGPPTCGCVATWASRSPTATAPSGSRIKPDIGARDSA